MSAKPGDDSRTVSLERRNRELSILNRIAEGLNREVDLSQALDTVLGQVGDLLGLQTGWVWLFNEKTGQSYLAASRNLPPGLERNPRLMEGSCYCLYTYIVGDLEGAANVNVVKCSRLAELVDGTDGLSYHASIPLYAPGEKQLGVLNVASTSWRELSDDDLRLLNTIGDLLSIAVERARLFEQRAELGAVEERNRLAREIHDTLAQGLAAISLQIETAEIHLEKGTELESARQAVHKALELTRDNLEEAKRSVLDLRAAPLEGRTLTEALARMIDGMSKGGPLVVRFETAGVAPPLPSRIEVALYRMAQEALANVAKHAEAGEATVRLVSTPNEIFLSIEDNGLGFEPSAIPSMRYGLVGINERAKLLGGNANVESSVGVGTRVEIRVPIVSSGMSSDQSGG